MRINNINNLSTKFVKNNFYYCNDSTRKLLNSCGIFEVGTCLSDDKEIQFIFFNNEQIKNIINKK